MNRLRDPGVLALVAIVIAFLIRDTGYVWVPIALWVAYQVGSVIYAMGRADADFDRRHPPEPSHDDSPPGSDQ